jgi:hypothetical protein
MYAGTTLFPQLMEFLPCALPDAFQLELADGRFLALGDFAGMPECVI